MVIIEMILLPMIFLQIGLGESRGYAGKNERLGERMRGPAQYSTEDPLLGQEVESTGKVSLCQEIHPKAWAHPHPQGGLRGIISPAKVPATSSIKCDKSAG